MGGGLIFVMAAATWACVRAALRVSETQRRTMWVATIGLCVLPAWMGWSQEPLVTTVAWPFLAGIMAGELGWTRFASWRTRQALERKSQEGETQRTQGQASDQGRRKRRGQDKS